jgi:hypothetical protein
MKFTQIAVAGMPEDDDHFGSFVGIYALGEDGIVYTYSPDYETKSQWMAIGNKVRSNEEARAA